MHDLLEARPDNDVEVLAVWLPVLGGSRVDEDRIRSAIDGPAVTHYWDSEAVTGRWFAENLPWRFSRPPAWDVFYLFGPDATWTDTPGDVIAWDYTIVAGIDLLEEELDRVLATY